MLYASRHGIAVPYVNQRRMPATTGLKSISIQRRQLGVEMHRRVASTGRFQGVQAKQISPRLPANVLTSQS